VGQRLKKSGWKRKATKSSAKGRSTLSPTSLNVFWSYKKPLFPEKRRELK
jgi:hypothetical protein